MPQRIITTHRAGIIWNYITWASLLLFLLSGFAAMMTQTMLPANLGYPQLHSPGVPQWVGLTVVSVEVLAFLIPPVVTTLCARNARRLGVPAGRAVAVSWGVFALVAALCLLLWFLG